MKNGSCCGNSEPQKDDSKSECGCGFIEYRDQCRIPNPSKPSVMVDEGFLKDFEEYAGSLGIKKVGYALVTPDVVIAERFIQYPSAIVLTAEMDEELIKTAPGEEAQRLNSSLYDRLAEMTFRLADYLRERGYFAEAIHPMSGILNLTLMAQRAGIGFTGHSGLLITPESGPAQKVSAIITSIASLPLKDDNEHEWITEYCKRCGKCIRACPEEALIEFKGCCSSSVVLMDERCIGCSQGCTFCIENCPFYTKGYHHIRSRFERLMAKPEAAANSR